MALKEDIAQADWSQNDETAIDYVKGRTHWKEDSIETITVLQNTTIEGGTTATVACENGVAFGVEHKVIFNGVTYNCTPWPMDSSYYLGNGSLIGETYASLGGNEPFLIRNNTNDNSMTVKTNESGTHTISITYDNIIYHIIDEHYLPILIGKSGSGFLSEIFNNPINEASGKYSHAEGSKTIASNSSAHAEGYVTTASGFASHAEGAGASGTGATGDYSHSEGGFTIASGMYTHAEGYGTVASGQRSHAEGWNTISAGEYQHAQGKNNIEDTTNKYAHIVGNGKSKKNRSNAHTLDWEGNAWYAGTLRVGGTFYDDAKEVALKEDIPTVATENKLGTVKVSAKTDDMTQPIGVDENGFLFTAPGGSGTGLGDFRLIRSVTIPEDPSADTSGVAWLARESGGYWFGFDTDSNGATFDLKELVVICEGVASAGGDLTWRFNSGATPFYGSSGTTIDSYSPTENKAWQWIYFLGAFTQYIGCKNGGANVNNAQANRYMLTDRPISSISSISTYHNNGNAYGITAGTIHFYGR